MTSPLWYCARNGHTYGPFDADALRSLVLQSRVHPTDAISNGGAWFSVASIPGLFTAGAPTVTSVAPMPLALSSTAASMSVGAAAVPVAATPLVPPAALLPPRPVPSYAPAYASAPTGMTSPGMMGAGGFPVASAQPVAPRRPLATSWRTAAPWTPGSSFRSKTSPWILGAIALLLVMWLWGVWTIPLAAVPA